MREKLQEKQKTWMVFFLPNPLTVKISQDITVADFCPADPGYYFPGMRIRCSSDHDLVLFPVIPEPVHPFWHLDGKPDPFARNSRLHDSNIGNCEDLAGKEEAKT